MNAVNQLKNLYINQTCYIIGKGPSLQYFVPSKMIGKGPVFTINDALVHVEHLLPYGVDLYSVQRTGHHYLMHRPKFHSTWLILQKPFSEEFFTDHPKRMFVDPVEFGMDPVEMSIRVLVSLIKITGCSKITFVSCDNLAIGDSRTFRADRSITESKDVWYDSAKQAVFEDLKEISYDFITPKEK